MNNTRKENAIIMAAGISSRFAPLSYEIPKALIKVKGEVLIERQINQLRDAGINDITIVVGYRAEMFDYLKFKYNVDIVMNEYYKTKNNISSLHKVKDKIKNTLVCSADNYFVENPFFYSSETAYYSSIFVEGKTDEWCLEIDESDFIKNVNIGGHDSWVMIGHAYFSEDFSNKFLEIMEYEYNHGDVAEKLWEHLYKNNLKDLPMKVRKFPSNLIKEFDSLEELREFDSAYRINSGSLILEKIAEQLNIYEIDIINITPIFQNQEPVGFNFNVEKKNYCFFYKEEILEESNNEATIK